MSGFKTPGRPGPLPSEDATEDDAIERTQALLVAIVATAVMVAISLSNTPPPNRGISLGFGVMIFIIGFIDIEYFKDINRFERRLVREGHRRRF